MKVPHCRDLHLYSPSFLGVPIGEAAAVRAEGGSFAGENTAIL